MKSKSFELSMDNFTPGTPQVKVVEHIITSEYIEDFFEQINMFKDAKNIKSIELIKDNHIFLAKISCDTIITLEYEIVK